MKTSRSLIKDIQKESWVNSESDFKNICFWQKELQGLYTGSLKRALTQFLDSFSMRLFFKQKQKESILFERNYHFHGDQYPEAEYISVFM